MQRGGRAIHCNGVAGATVVPYGFFEPVYCRTLRKPVGVEDCLHGSNVILVDVLPTIGNPNHALFRFRSSPIDRKRRLVPELYSKPSATYTPASPSALMA